MADVFISYHEGSAGELVQQIAAALDRVGISCWYANRDIYEGNFVGEITRAIRDCRVFLLILNREALSSRYMQSETMLGFRRVMNREPMTLLAFRADDCDWKESKAYGVQIMDGTPPDEAHIRALVKRVSRILGRETRRPAEQAAQRTAENR